jgi:hypothetical protein
VAHGKLLRLLGAALALILAGCGPSGGALAPTALPTGLPATPAAPVTPSPTIDWFPPTSTPTIAPTQPITPTPNPRDARGPAILADAISNQPWSAGKSAAGAITRSGSELTLAVSAARGTLTSFLGAPELGDASLEVAVDPSLCRGADSFGLLLRSTGQSSFYRWSITCDGTQTLERVKNGAFLALQPPIPRAGPPTPTVLAVSLSGQDLRFFIDDVYQFSIKDPLYTTGRLGVFARSAGDTPLTVTFSSFSVYSLSSLTPSPSPGGRGEKTVTAGTTMPTP